ncbi:NAD-dependent epimerase/dehydratase family protein [Actinomadura harenae]|nr:NAD-dependent epimerase/dehydratase family protein [Actinomadura harenae]
MGSSVAGSASAERRPAMDTHPLALDSVGTVLVTGACGFIGSHVCLELVRRGMRVIGVDVRPMSWGIRPGHVLGLLVRQPGFEMVCTDLAGAQVTALLGDVDVVVHLAAATDVAASWGEGFTEHTASVLAAQRLLMACEDARVRRLVVASSAHVYGPVDRANPDAPVGEDAPVEPTSPYGIAKLAAERLALTYARRSTSMSTVALRYFPAFGGGVNPRMVVPRWLTASRDGTPVPLFGDGTALHTWTDISDLVEATLRAVAVSLEPGRAEVVNAAGHTVASLRRLAELIEEVTGRPVPLEVAGDRAGDAAATRADLTRANALLGFVPRVPLKEGLERLWGRLDTEPVARALPFTSSPVPGSN